MTHGGCGEVLVVGEIDEDGARILDAVLGSRVRDGSALVVDLREVSYLQSVGVAVLYDHAEGTDLALRVRTGSAVATVVAICGLAHVATIELDPEPQV